MKMRMFEIVQTLEALKKCGNVTGLTGYAIHKNKDIFTRAASSFLEMRDAAIKKYGEKMEDGGYKIGPDAGDFTAFMSEINPLLAIDEEVEPYQIAEPDIPYIEQLSAQEYDILESVLRKEGKDEAVTG